MHIWGPMHSHIFIYLKFNIYFSVLTIYAFVYGYKQHALLLMLLERFSLYERGEISLESVCDDARRLIACSPNGAAFSCYTSIKNVCAHLLSTNAVVSERYYVCPNGHHVHHSKDYDAFLSAEVHEYESIAQWVSTETHHACAQCEICAQAVSLKLRFCHSPPLLGCKYSHYSFSFSGANHFLLIFLVYYPLLSTTTQTHTQPASSSM